MATRFSWERSPTWGYGNAGDPWTRRSGTKPKVSSPPPSFYDPSIDASVAATNRGFGDLFSDTVRDFGEPGTAFGGRQGEDFLVGRGRLDRNKGFELADAMRGFGRSSEDLQSQSESLTRGFGRSFADLLSDRQRGQEDYGTSIQGLDRNYQRLGDSQTQAARSAGIVRGGALAASQNRRDSNKAIDRQPIDTGFQRFLSDSTLSEQRLREDQAAAQQALARSASRLGEDSGSAQQRINAGYGDQFRDLDTSYSRGGEDSAQGLARALREALQFSVDADSLRAAQARQLGWPFR